MSPIHEGDNPDTPGGDAGNQIIDDAGDPSEDTEEDTSCGAINQDCCSGGVCDGTLSCKSDSDICVEPRDGDVGTPCTRNADCDSELCLPLGDGSAVCTEPCSTTAECTPGWQCDSLAGVATDVCICEVQPETCSGLDDDCNGVIDNFEAAQASCGVGATCDEGQCGCIDECDGVCVDVDNDPENCGGCGNICGEGEACEQGQCLCRDECDGVCTNTDNDRENCGSCGNSCQSGTWCEEGRCTNSALQVSAGGTHSCAVTSGSEIRCWGENEDGQLNSSGCFRADQCRDGAFLWPGRIRSGSVLGAQ